MTISPSPSLLLFHDHSCKYATESGRKGKRDSLLEDNPILQDSNFGNFHLDHIIVFEELPG
jgi:hypothetical protein